MVKYSNFHLTVNFNKNDPRLAPHIREAVETLVDDDVWPEWLMQYDGSNRVPFTAEDEYLVTCIRLRAALENKGMHNKGLHVHVLIEVTHDTMVQLDKQALINHFRRIVGAQPNVHFRFVRGAGDDKDFILHYITKEVPTRRSKNPENVRLARALRSGELVDAETCE